MTTNYSGSTGIGEIYNSGNTGAITVGIPDWNVTIQQSSQLVVDESQLIATEAILYMSVNEFSSLFSQNADQIIFASDAASTLKTAMKRQSVVGSSGFTGAPAITDSFLIKNSVLHADGTNIFEYNLLKNAYEKFGFKDAFIAFTSASRLSSLEESIGMSRKALDHITNTEYGFAPAVAQKIYLDVLSERNAGATAYRLGASGVSGASGASGGAPSNIFQQGDRFTFALTCTPPSTNPEFIEQVFRCIIQLVDGTSGYVYAKPYTVGNLRVVSNSDYSYAYANASSSFSDLNETNGGVIISKSS